MILATILFVLSAGSAVLAGEVCDDAKTITTIPVDIMKIPNEWFYCGSYVKGQVEPLCSLEITKKTETTADLTLKGKEGSPDATKKVTLELNEGTKGVYTTTLVDDASDIKLVTYITGATNDTMCMSYVKCFEGGKWYGSEQSGTFTGVVCPTKAVCMEESTKNFLKAVFKEDEYLECKE